MKKKEIMKRILCLMLVVCSLTGVFSRMSLTAYANEEGDAAQVSVISNLNEETVEAQLIVRDGILYMEQEALCKAVDGDYMLFLDDDPSLTGYYIASKGQDKNSTMDDIYMMYAQEEMLHENGKIYLPLKKTTEGLHIILDYNNEDLLIFRQTADMKTLTEELARIRNDDGLNLAAIDTTGYRILYNSAVATNVLYNMFSFSKIRKRVTGEMKEENYLKAFEKILIFDDEESGVAMLRKDNKEIKEVSKLCKLYQMLPESGDWWGYEDDLIEVIPALAKAADLTNFTEILDHLYLYESLADANDNLEDAVRQLGLANEDDRAVRKAVDTVQYYFDENRTTINAARKGYREGVLDDVTDKAVEKGVEALVGGLEEYLHETLMDETFDGTLGRMGAFFSEETKIITDAEKVLIEKIWPVQKKMNATERSHAAMIIQQLCRTYMVKAIHEMYKGAAAGNMYTQEHLDGAYHAKNMAILYLRAYCAFFELLDDKDLYNASVRTRYLANEAIHTLSRYEREDFTAADNADAVRRLTESVMSGTVVRKEHVPTQNALLGTHIETPRGPSFTVPDGFQDVLPDEMRGVRNAAGGYTYMYANDALGMQIEIEEYGFRMLPPPYADAQEALKDLYDSDAAEFETGVNGYAGVYETSAFQGNHYMVTAYRPAQLLVRFERRYGFTDGETICTIRMEYDVENEEVCRLLCDAFMESFSMTR